MPVEGGRSSGETGVAGESEDTLSDPLFVKNELLGEILDELSLGGLPVGPDPRVVTARGTEHGLILRIDGRAEWTLVRQELDNFLGGRKKFFEGGEVSIEWIDRLPSTEQSKELGEYLLSQYGLKVVTRRRRFNVEHGSASTAGASTAGASVGSVAGGHAPSGLAAGGLSPGPESASIGLSAGASRSVTGNTGSTINLFQDLGYQQSNSANSGAAESGGAAERHGYFSDRSPGSRGSAARDGSREGTREGGSKGMFDEEFQAVQSSLHTSLSSPKRVASQMAKILGGPDLMYEDEANAKILFGTLRSGQRVETPFSLIIIGDVNPGADLVAGGDIIVLGSLRGTAQASAYDDDSFDRVIIALHMQPMQLRIGSVLSRGSEEVVRGAEIARIENRRIVVEAFNPRMLWGRKLR